ncbi:MAG: heavy metal translocating P-type ATPase [Pyramidobacter sp.]|jgi:Cd2+/Zn2+-exporting ATPase
MNKKQKKMLCRIAAASAMMVALHFVQFEGVARFALYLLPYLTVGYDILLKAGKGIARRQVFDENFLMATATVGAMALAVSGSGDYTEAIAVMLFYQVGELFQSIAVGRSRKSIGALMDIRPDSANVEGNGQLARVSPDEVPVGTVIVVQPGEKVPIDGVVTEGSSTLNAAALTGESAPLSVAAGSEILSGCINMTGVLKIRTTREFSASTASKILDLVENASSRKSRSEEFISRFARVYTPAVCCSALALAVLPPVLRLIFMGAAPLWSLWIYRALIFLVISCPCALVISIPLSFFAGIGGASRQGILVKGANFFETLSQTKCVVFDKTGTLTRGVFEVAAVHHCPIDPKKLLEYAALAESASSHPISKSLKEAYGRPLDRRRVTDIREYSGEGVTARVDGAEVAAGNAKLMNRFGIPFIACRSAGSIVHMAIGGEYAGHVVISDLLKPHAKETIERLRQAGVRKTVMLTGDRRAVAEKVAEETGVDEFHAELLPADKVAEVEKLLAGCKRGEKLAFVGDGINDAPVLSRADVGIAMGAMGSDAAIEAADVVLMDDDPLKIAKAIAIARHCLRIVKENIWFAIGVKAICLLTGALGLTGMGFAIFADVGVMVLAVLNAIRALFVKGL